MRKGSATPEAKLRCLSGATSVMKANYWIFQKSKKWLLNGYRWYYINLQLDELPKKQGQSILKSLCFLIIFLHSLRPLVRRGLCDSSEAANVVTAFRSQMAQAVQSEGFLPGCAKVTFTSTLVLAVLFLLSTHEAPGPVLVGQVQDYNKNIRDHLP